MKIEKLTENKIRIIIKQEELKDKSLDLHTIMTKAAESQGLFLEILDRAKKEIGFNADGHKLLIEAFSSSDDVMVFTITKYEVIKDDNKNSAFPISHKNLKVKRKINVIESVETDDSKEIKNGIVIYFVQNGDTLWNIAKHYGVPYEEILEFNKLEDEGKIYPGQRLFIP